MTGCISNAFPDLNILTYLTTIRPYCLLVSFNNDVSFQRTVSLTISNLSFPSVFFPRYQYYLQLKTDVIDGKLPCSEEQAVRLASYSVQGEQLTRAGGLIMYKKEIQGSKIQSVVGGQPKFKIWLSLS